MTNHPEGINTKLVCLCVGAVCVCVHVCFKFRALCNVSHTVSACAYFCLAPSHGAQSVDTNPNPTIWIILLFCRGAKWTAPTHHWGTAVNLAAEKAGWLRTESKPAYTTLILAPLEVTSKMSGCPKSTIWDGEEKTRPVFSARTVTHPWGLLKPRSLEDLWW